MMLFNKNYMIKIRLFGNKNQTLLNIYYIYLKLI